MNIEEQVRNRIDMELELSPEDRAKLIRKFTSDIKKLLDQQRQECLSELRSIKKWTKGKNIPPTVKDELRHKLNQAILKIKERV